MKTATVKITENCRYCPAQGEAENLEPGDEREMAPEDAYNIVGASRGVIVSENQ